MNEKALFRITYGLYLLTALQDRQDNGCIINTVMQVSENPVRIAVSVNQKNLTHDMIKATGLLNISVLSTEADFALFQRFGMQSGRDVDKFGGFFGIDRSQNQLIYLKKACCAYLSAKVLDSVDLGMHTLFIAEVTDGDVLSDVPGCTYGYYQSHIKPKPAAAATPKKQWVCKVCGYVYEGDEVPDDYLCPLCRHGKADFELLAPASAPKRWKCKVCGHIYEGDEVPEDYICPLCKQGKDAFELLPPVPEKKKWVCKVCGYVYEGDEIPDDYLCPLCKHGKADFEPLA